MTKIERLVEIDRAPDEVFGLLCSAENLPEWLPGVTRTQLLEGNRSLWTLDRAGEVDARIVERNAPNLVRWQVSRDGEVLSLTGALTETRSGDTILRVSLDGDGGSAVESSTHTLTRDLFGAAASNDLQLTLAEALRRFKSIVEGAPDEDASREAPAIMYEGGAMLPPVALSPVAAPSETRTQSATIPVARRDSQTADAGSETTLVTASPRVARAAITSPVPVATSPAPVAAAAHTPARSNIAAPQRRGGGLMTLAFASLAAVLLLAAIAWAFLNGRSGGVLNNDPPPQTTAADAPAAASPEPRAAAQPTPSASAAVDEPAPADSSDFALPPASTNGARANAPDSGTASQPMRAGASTGDNAAVLRDSLGEWINATNAADLGAQMRFYAPTLERYYLRRGFTRDAVRGDKAALGKRARLRNVEIEDPQITVAPDNTTATMRFRKNYSFDDSPTRNAVLQELRWRRTPEGWRIISERDLRVLR